MANAQPKNILIGPLDWGAGHTARCIPLVAYLQEKGHHVIVAGTVEQHAFLRQWVSDKTTTVLLEGYGIRYTGANRFLQMGLLSQLPRILTRIRNEHKWLLQQAEALRIDGIISDNRYGLYHPRIPGVIITHQLQIRSGAGNGADNIVQRMHYRYLDRFDAVWIPDVPESPGLAGLLSHSAKMPRHYSYLGLLSRLYRAVAEGKQRAGTVLFLISGPEPQRSVFAELAWKEAIKYDGKVIFAEGAAHARQPAHLPAHINWYGILGGHALTEALAEAGVVVCRSGYSTLMDLAAIGKRAIVVPTPGQTEQEYLADMVHQQGFFHRAFQDRFDLLDSLSALHTQTINNPYRHLRFDSYTRTIDKWLETL